MMNITEGSNVDSEKTCTANTGPCSPVLYYTHHMQCGHYRWHNKNKNNKGIIGIIWE